MAVQYSPGYGKGKGAPGGTVQGNEEKEGSEEIDVGRDVIAEVGIDEDVCRTEVELDIKVDGVSVAADTEIGAPGVTADTAAELAMVSLNEEVSEELILDRSGCVRTVAEELLKSVEEPAIDVVVPEGVRLDDGTEEPVELLAVRSIRRRGPTSDSGRRCHTDCVPFWGQPAVPHIKQLLE